jgi:hypothetical protein
MRLGTCLLATAFCAALPLSAALAGSPDLKGQWAGKGDEVNAKNEFFQRDLTISILDQNGRLFWGTVSHPATGTTEKFIGVIRSDNKTFYLVDVDDQGMAEGEILGPDQIESCHFESGHHAIASCTLLGRKH